jgi:flagellar biosynthesis protein FlhG
MRDPHRDQAEGLRRLFSRRGAHVITVASGCNGVGATGTVVNLAGALAARGHRILAIDENYGAGNVAGSLGLRTRRDLHDVLAGGCALEDALLTGPGDITVLPAAAGVRALSRLDSAGQARLTAALTRLGERFDILLIDARSGTLGGFSSLGHAVQDTVVVCSAAAAAITESYALIKRLHGSDRRAPLPAAPQPRRRRGRRAPHLRQPRARVPQASRDAAGVAWLRAPRRAHAARGRDRCSRS